MDDFPLEEVLFLIQNHQEKVRLMLKASNDRTLRRIRRSRRNLQRAKEQSFAHLLESFRAAAAGAVISVSFTIVFSFFICFVRVFLNLSMLMLFCMCMLCRLFQDSGLLDAKKEVLIGGFMMFYTHMMMTNGWKTFE